MDWFCSCLPQKKDENSAIQAYKPINSDDIAKVYPRSGQEVNIARSTPSEAIASIIKDTNRIRPIELPSKSSGYISVEELRQKAAGNVVFRKIQKSDYEKIKAECERTKTKYTDPGFECEKNVFVAEWKRLPEILPTATFMEHPIRPNSFAQGQINDCYWMSGVASVAERDYRIKNIFGSLEISPHGVYMCRLTYNGVFQEVVVDDYFPVNNKGELVFARPSMSTDCWGIILEKCWAKLFGCYRKIDFGFNSEALNALSGGAPVKRFQLENFKSYEGYKALFRMLEQHQERNHVVTCSVQAKKDYERHLHIQVGHAYSVLGAFRTKLNGDEIRLIQLRNPLAYSGVNVLLEDGRKVRVKEPSLPFSTSDPFWKKVSEEEKKRLQYWMIEKEGDGVFYMELMQFAMVYDEVAICEINDNAHYLYETATFANYEPRYISLHVQLLTDKFYLILTQKNRRRILPDNIINTKARYASICVLVAKIDINHQNKEVWTYISSKAYNYDLATNYFPADLGLKESGRYLIRIDAQIPFESETDITIGYYSPDDFQANLREKVDDGQFLDRVLLDRARKLPGEKKTALANASGWQCIENIPGSSLSYAAYRIDSISSHKKYKITVDEKNEDESRVVFLGNWLHQYSFELDVLRGNEAIFVYIHKEQLPDPELVPNAKDERPLPNITFLPIQQ